MKLYQYQNAYRYNSDSLFLYDFICQDEIKGEVLDIGAGCGILGLLIRRDFDANVELLDIQEENILLCQENAKLNKLCVKLSQEDFVNFETSLKYDIIVSNPPFYHEGAQKSDNTHLALSRYSEFLPLKSLVKNAHKALKHRGKMYICYDAKQVAFVLSELKEGGFGVEKMRFIHPKKQSASRLVLLKCVKGSRSLCEVLPPLYASDENGYTKEAQLVFEKADTVSLEWKN